MTESIDEIPANNWILSPEQELKLLQLDVIELWKRRQIKNTPGEPASDSSPNSIDNTLPAHWNLLRDITLYDWQQECIDKWLVQRRGIIKVVTGAGKTVLALGIIEKLKNSAEPDLHVAIVVPTIVLMEQWYEELIRHSNIPPKYIGRLGSDYTQSFETGCRILICVLNSAHKKLPQIVSSANCKDSLLLIVDECHRAGADQMKKVFETKRKYNLGLSATPERGDSDDESENADAKGVDQSLGILEKEIGNVIYEMTLKEAIDLEILPPFTLNHFGLPLTPKEKHEYSQVSKKIDELKDELLSTFRAGGKKSKLDFNIWVRKQSSIDSQTGMNSRKYVAALSRRKSLLYRAESRRAAVKALLRQEFEANSDARVILFHESIDEAMEMWLDLVNDGLSAVPENSELKDDMRARSIAYFRSGKAKILVSVKSLVEGFNVPAADVGIVVASSTSVRQRIQTLGRVLRKHKTLTGEEKHSVIHVLYIRDTVDEVIYEKTDWEDFTGKEKNQYFKWDIDVTTVPEEQAGAPRNPRPNELQIEVSNLSEGTIYPGRYEGEEYSCDSNGNVFISGRKSEIVRNPQGVPSLIRQIKGQYGSFCVTPKKRYVITWISEGDKSHAVYVTQLKEPFEIYVPPEGGESSEPQQPGDIYSGDIPADTLELFYRRSKGRYVIAKKIKNGESYARCGSDAFNQESGAAAVDLLRVLDTYKNTSCPEMHKFQLTPNLVAFTILDGKPRFIHKLSANLDFGGE